MAVSRRFGTNDQTDVFVVDTKGQLNVFSAVGSGAWSGPQAIGPTGFAHAGGTVAASQHVGANSQTDVFLMDTKGQLNVFSIKNGGQWSDPLALSPQNAELSGAVVVASPRFGVANQTDVFFFNHAGTTGEGWPTIVWAEGPNAWNSPKALVNEI